MGLAIYAGPLCRYYFYPTGLQRLLGVFRKSPEARIHNWRAALAARGFFHPSTNWDWPESLDGQTKMDKPSHFGWSAVRMWSVCGEHPDRKPSQELPEEQEETLFQAVTKYTHIVRPELWLPVEFDVVFEAEPPVGKRLTIGSTHRLFHEMQQLNAVTWNASDAEIHQWNFTLDEDDLESTAQWGFAIWYALAKFAHENRLPMILDY